MILGSYFYYKFQYYDPYHEESDDFGFVHGSTAIAKEIDIRVRRSAHKVVKLINVLSGYKIWDKKDVPEI